MGIKMKKQLKNLFILAGLTLSFCCVNPILAKADTITEMEDGITRSNDTLETAEEIPVNSIVNGKFSDYLDNKNDGDMYKFVLPSTGTIDIDLTSHVNATDLVLYDESGNEILEEHFMEWNESIKLLYRTFSYKLKKGSYYVRVNNTKNSFMDFLFDKYTFKLDFVSSNVNHGESNNEFSTAEQINFNKKYISQISINDRNDFQKFKVESAGTYQLKGNTKLYKMYITLYSSNGDLIKDFTVYEDGNTKQGVINENFFLEKGEYVLFFTSQETGSYNFTLNPLVNKIKLNKSSLTLKKGKTFQLKASITPTAASNKKVTWKSSNKSVITVSATGKVTAKKKGTAYVSCTAKDGSGITKKIKIKVK